jgi:Arylsulfotransferase (ASST)
VLAQTQVLFEYDEIAGADYYEVVIKADYSLPGAPDLVRVRNKSLAVIVSEGLQFGAGYQWYYEAFRGGKLAYRCGEIFFSIKSCPFADTSLYRFDVSIAEKNRYQDGVIFIDQFGLAINRQGRPVWFLGSQADSIRSPFRNMQLTPDGTVTYQDNSDCSDVALTGETVWKGPNTGQVSGDSSEYYHHDFIKLPGGTYITAGYFFRNEPNFYDNSVTTKVRYNTLIEYDSQGKVLWTWNEKDHISKEAIFRNIRSDANLNEGTHLNGFSYDAAANGFLLSFRNNSTVLKIDKATGKVLYSLADALKGPKGAAPYNSQHGPYVMRNGNVLVYNNNSQTAAEGGTDSPWPRVQQYSQPKGAQPARLVWEYELRSPRYRNGLRGKEGYAQELPNGNVLICAGGGNFTCEVTPDKKRVWECYFEKADPLPDGGREWRGFTNYRSHFSTSLYPRWFTAQQLTRSRQALGPKRLLQVQVNNEGTVMDEYVLVFTDNNGRSLPPQTVAIPARSSKKVSFSLPVHAVPAGAVAGSAGRVTVQPKRAEHLKREMVVEVY